MSNADTKSTLFVDMFLGGLIGLAASIAITPFTTPMVIQYRNELLGYRYASEAESKCRKDSKANTIEDNCITNANSKAVQRIDTESKEVLEAYSYNQED